VPYIIAELGINHNGDIALAEQMITVAKQCGADAVKFQKRTVELVYTQEFLDSPRESPWGTTQRDQKLGLEFGQNEYERIDEICRKAKIDWFASAWDLESLKFLQQFHPPYHKIASPMLTDLDFVQAISHIGTKTLISTGMSSTSQVMDAVNIFQMPGLVYGSAGCPFAILHCVSIYPCPLSKCNISRIPYLAGMFPDIEIGYSGHEVGTPPTEAAIALGAKYIERHFTLDRSMYGSDQAASLEPKGLSIIVEHGRAIEESLGDPHASCDPEEMKNAAKLRWKHGK